MDHEIYAFGVVAYGRFDCNFTAKPVNFSIIFHSKTSKKVDYSALQENHTDDQSYFHFFRNLSKVEVKPRNVHLHKGFHNSSVVTD